MTTTATTTHTSAGIEVQAKPSAFNRLRLFNLAMGVLHLVQGVLMVLISNDFTVPIKTYFLTLDEQTDALVTNPDVWLDLRLGPFVALFLFISAAAHFTIAAPGVFGWYKRNLKQGANFARWIEYSLSASVMIVAIATLTGIYDIAALIGLFAANTAMILFGWQMELLNRHTDRVRWEPFIFGSIIGLAPWIAIGAYFFGSIGQGEGPPDFVYGIFFSLFVFFNIFAVNQFLQYKQVGRWKNYLFGEVVYIVLSLTAKSALAWQVFFGTLQP